jgi:FSR family fosmidomycin resistance protein-like MFS transporter
MDMKLHETAATGVAAAKDATVVPILVAISFSHLLNDLIQSLIPALYPILKSTFSLDFAQVGLITLTFQLTASLLQPVVGLYTDRKPSPFSLVIGMGFTLVGLLLLSKAASYPMLLASAALVGMGSSIFHPESSRVARMASGGRHGLAQSVFQVGGYTGSALGPLLAAFIVVPRGQGSIGWFSIVALVAAIVLFNVGRWYRERIQAARKRPAPAAPAAAHMPARRVTTAIVILVALVFSKQIYIVSLSNYFTFFLIGKFHLSVQAAQVHLFIFLGAVAVGTLIGGPVGDRIGRKYVIWCSILGVLPFSLLLPYANLFWTGVLSVIIGLVLSSAFSAILVFAQDLVPGRVGLIAGLFFGLSFGLGGVGAAALGELADRTSMDFVYRVCSFLPAIGLLTYFLPDIERPARQT